MEEWNEHIEEIIQNKSFEDLTPEDIEVLGEIASDAKSYESYRQLLNNVIPAVKEENIQPSPGLDEKIKSIIEKDSKKGGGYFNWVKFAAAAAVLIAVFSVSYWIIENNSLGEAKEVAQNTVKDDKGEEESAENNKDMDSVKKDARPADKVVIEDNKNSQETSLSKQEQPSLLNKEELSGNSVIDKTIVEEEVADSRKRNNHSDQLEDAEPYSEMMESTDELELSSPSIEGALEESHEKSNARRIVDNDLYDDNADISSKTGVTRSNAGGVYANAPVEDDVRDDILGSIELSKPASSQEDAFDLLTIAF